MLWRGKTLCSEVLVDEEFVDAVANLRIIPGREPSRNPLQAVKAWICTEDDEEIIRALHNDLADDLLDESVEQVKEVIDSDDDGILGIEGGERAVSSTPSGSRPLPPFPTVVNICVDLEDLAMQSGERDVIHYLGKANLAWLRVSTSRVDRLISAPFFYRFGM